MKFQFSTGRILDNLVENFYSIVMFLYLFAVFIQSISVATIGGFLLITIGFLTIWNRKGRIDKNIVYLYLIVMFFSGIQYMYNDMSISFFLSGLVYCAVPVFIYIAPKYNTRRIIDKTFIAILLSLVIGFIFYLWGPDFFGQYLVKHSFISRVNQVSYSLQGLYGITAVGTYSACCTIFFYGKWLENKKSRMLFATLFSILCLVVAMRRSAVAACILMFAIENLVFYFKFRKNQRIQLFVTSLIIIMLIVVFVFENTEIMGIIDRVTDVSGAVSERRGNWQMNYAEIKKYLFFGKGLGSSGHIASAVGYLAIHDNSYLLILREIGVVGLVSFVVVIISNVYFFMKRDNKTEMEYIALFVVLIFLIQAFGSNVWEFPISAALFWFMLSICRKGIGNLERK